MGGAKRHHKILPCSSIFLSFVARQELLPRAQVHQIVEAGFEFWYPWRSGAMGYSPLSATFQEFFENDIKGETLGRRSLLFLATVETDTHANRQTTLMSRRTL